MSAKRATACLIALIGLLVTIPALVVPLAPAFAGQDTKKHDLGPVTSFPVGEFVVARFAVDSSPGTVSRRLAYVRNNGSFHARPSFTILSGRDTFLGCPLAPNGEVMHDLQWRYRGATLLPVRPLGFGSPCHDRAQYDREGNQTAGPPGRALDRYAFSIRDGHLLLGKLFSVARVDGTGAAARIDARPFAPPGEQVSGIEAWLYPLQPSG